MLQSDGSVSGKVFSMLPSLMFLMIVSQRWPQLSSQVGYFSLSHLRSAFETPAFGFQNSVGRQNQVPMCMEWCPCSSATSNCGQYHGLSSP